MKNMGVEPKIGGKPTKWMVYYNGKPYEQMDDLGGIYHPYFWFNTHIILTTRVSPLTSRGPQNRSIGALKGLL